MFDKAGKVPPLQTVLEFTITPFATADEALMAQWNESVSGTRVVHNMKPAPAVIIGAEGVIDRVNSITNAINPITSVWDPLLDKIKLFSEIVDKASEVWFKIGCLPGHLIPTGCLLLGSPVY
jgi:hypothetical protein